MIYLALALIAGSLGIVAGVALCTRRDDTRPLPTLRERKAQALSASLQKYEIQKLEIEK